MTMKKSKSDDLGLTLLEIVIALFVLAVGVMAVAALQGSSLRATGTARAVQELNEDARSELSIWRSKLSEPGTKYTTATAGACTTEAVCTIQIKPCQFDGAGQLNCEQPSVAQPVAHAVTVTIEDASGRELSAVALSTVVVRSASN